MPPRCTTGYTVHMNTLLIFPTSLPRACNYYYCRIRASPSSGPLHRTPPTLIVPPLGSRSRSGISAARNAVPIPARDRRIDFGKHKGKMLGTLSSDYLKWVSKNLRAGDFEEWARLADQVLADPVYRDRIEWESFHKLLAGDVPSSSSSNDGGVVAELLELSERFGWDNEDKVGWSKIDFGFLGTSKGGRIPRISERENNRSDARGGLDGPRATEDEEGAKRSSSGRQRRRERLRSKLRPEEPSVVSRSEDAINRTDGRPAEIRNPFPGRKYLLNKVLNKRDKLA